MPITLRSKLFLAAALLLSALTLGGCNTVEGMGQDLGAAGRGISDSAEDVQGRY